MRIERRLKILSCLLPLIVLTLFGFQNCGRGFKAAGIPENSSYSFSKPGTILPLSLFASTNSTSTPIDTDLTPYLQNVMIENLKTGPYLSNGYVVLDEDDEYPEVLASPAQLVYPATDPRLAGVNAYYHVNRLTSALTQLGVFPSTYSVTHVNAHCTDSDAENNSYFDPSIDLLCLGYSRINNFTVWAAFDADVIVHEFGHSINYAVTSDIDLLSSTQDLWALDEGVADLWAFLQNDNPYVAQYFGYVLTKATTPGAPELADFKGLRDLSSVPNYPASLQGEEHADSVVVSTIFYDLRQSGVPTDLLKKLAVRVLSDLQAGDTFAQVVDYIVEESAALNIESSKVQAALNARNLLRKDSVSGLTLASNKVFVIDNHSSSIQVGGNCNGKLDAGETAILYLDLQNSNSTLGTVATYLSTNAPANEVMALPGADFGWYIRFIPNSTYLQSLPNSARTVGSAAYFEHVYYAAFAIRASAAAAGKTYQFTLQTLAFNSVDSSPVLGAINFTIPVGSVANLVGKCPGTGENNVWPQ